MGGEWEEWKGHLMCSKGREDSDGREKVDVGGGENRGKEGKERE